MNKKYICASAFFITVTLYINGYECCIENPINASCITIKRDHTYLFDLHLQGRVGLDEALLKGEWNHAEVAFESSSSTMMSFLKDSRMHIQIQRVRSISLQLLVRCA
jgi:hypothetical protein